MTWTWGLPARALTAAGVAAVAVGLAATPVSARITVEPARAESGSYTTLAFSVSSERADESTTEVEIRFPEDHPMPGLTTEPKPGWDVTVETSGPDTASAEADDPADEPTVDPVAAVRWTASTSDAEIAPGMFEQFRVSVGPLPSDVDLLLFEARQTYSDGDVVSWDQESAGGSDPASARLAPTLTLVDQGATDLPASSSTSPTASPDAAAEPTPLETELLAENASATTDEIDDAAERVAIGLAVGGVLIFSALGATAFARRGGRGPAQPKT